MRPGYVLVELDPGEARWASRLLRWVMPALARRIRQGIAVERGRV